MPKFEDRHVKLDGGTVVWDGITNPGKIESGENAGNPTWSIKAVFPPNHPDVLLLDALARQALQDSPFRGILPQGGYMPIGTVQPNEFNGLFPGWSVISFKTYQHPQVFDESGNGNLLDPMTYGPQMYTGQKVDILAHCRDYNNKSKGIAARLDGFSIRVSENAPRQAFGNTVNAAAAFGGSQQQPVQQQPVQQQPVQQQPVQQQPVQQQPVQQQPVQQQPVQQQPVQQQPVQQQPVQAHNYLPS